MKLLIDMNIPLIYLKLLSEKGLDVVSWSEIGKNDATDIEIMEYARINGYIIMT